MTELHNKLDVLIELYKEDELDLNKEAEKAKKSNKLVEKKNTKKPIKKTKKVKET